MIKIEHPENMNLLGLILANMLKKNLQNEGCVRLVKKLSSSINVQAGRMKANLSFTNGDVIIRRGFSYGAHAYVSGSLNAFIDLGLRRNLLIRFLKGDVKVGGNIIKLLPLLKLLSI